MRLLPNRKVEASTTRVFFAATLILLCLSSARAQGSLTPARVEVKALAGGASFGLDEAQEVHQKGAGAALRVYLSKRWSIEPEFIYLRRNVNDQDYFFNMSVAHDFADMSGRVVPYLLGGVGFERNHGREFGKDFNTGEPRVFDLSFKTWTAHFGAGMKIFLTDRLFIAPEGRIGREPTFRGTIGIGYVLSGRRRTK